MPDPAAALTALRKAVDLIKQQSPGATDDDAIRLLQARAADPQAFEQFFAAPPPAPPAGDFLGAPLSNITDNAPPVPISAAPPPAIQTSSISVAPVPAGPASAVEPLFDNTPSRYTEKQAEFARGIASQTYEGPPPNMNYPFELGPRGAEVFKRTVHIDQEDAGPLTFGEPPVAYYDRGNIVSPADSGTFYHELAHAFQSEYQTDLSEFVAAVRSLAAAGNPVAQQSLQGYTQSQKEGMPHGAYQGAEDPQHLYTWFIDKELASPGSIPAELRSFYEGMFKYVFPSQAFRESQEQGIQTRSRTTGEEVAQAAREHGSLRALLRSGMTIGDIERVVRSVTNNISGPFIRMNVPDPETVDIIWELQLDDAETETIISELYDAGLITGTVDG